MVDNVLMLTETELDMIARCMAIVLDGGYIDACELHTRTGLREDELRRAMSAVPHLLKCENDDELQSRYGICREDVDLAIHNSLNEVCYGIDISDAALKADYGLLRRHVERVFARWLEMTDRPGGIA